MATGTVKWFNAQKGYGFIQPSDGSKDVFVHISAVERSGLGTLNAKSARQMEEQAKQLGNAYLPGAQNALHALTGLFYRSQISSEDELKASERERVYSAALDQLNRCFKPIPPKTLPICDTYRFHNPSRKLAVGSWQLAVGSR